MAHCMAVLKQEDNLKMINTFGQHWLHMPTQQHMIRYMLRYMQLLKTVGSSTEFWKYASSYS